MDLNLIKNNFSNYNNVKGTTIVVDNNTIKVYTPDGCTGYSQKYYKLERNTILTKQGKIIKEL